MSLRRLVHALVVGIACGLGGGAPAMAQLLSEIAQLTPAATDDRSFASVGISGNTAVATDGLSTFVFERNPETNVWSEAKQIETPGGVVAIHRDTIVLCASDHFNPNDSRGAAYVFERNEGGLNNWGQVATLPVGVSSIIPFLFSSLDETTFAVGASDFINNYVLIFERIGGSWTQTDAIFVATVLQGVALHGDTLVIGSDGGAAIYGRDQGGIDEWGVVTALAHGDPQPGDGFGNAVSIDGDTVAVGARGHDAGTEATNEGAVYVFERNLGGAGAWGQRARLTVSDAEPGDGLPRAVEVRGGLLLATSGGPDPSFEWKGSVYTFGRNQGGSDAWGMIQKLVRPNPMDDSRFGYDLELTGSPLVGYTAIIGNSLAEAAGVDAQVAFLYGNTRPQTTAIGGLTAGIAAGSQNLVIASVSDGEEGPETLAARVDGGTSATTNGVTVSNLEISADGEVTADVEIACGASDASFELTISDGFGLVSTSALEIDTEPSAAPVVTLAGPISLGSPNHKYRPVSVSQLVLSATDDCDGDVAASLQIEQITSDEPDDAPGGADGNTLNDTVVVDCTNLRLRAERNELGNGRVYGITLRARDSEGSAGRAVFAVRAPVESMGPAVEDAPAAVVPGCP